MLKIALGFTWMVAVAIAVGLLLCCQGCDDGGRVTGPGDAGSVEKGIMGGSRAAKRGNAEICRMLISHVKAFNRRPPYVAGGSEITDKSLAVRCDPSSG